MTARPRPTPPRFVALLLLLGACGSSRSLRLENDLGDLQRDYNHGTEVSWQVPANQVGSFGTSFLESGLVESLSTSAAPGTQQHLRWRIGQLLMVPVDISLPVPNPRDRPFAGSLYVGMSAERLALDPNDMRRRDRRSNVEVRLGVVGPASLNEALQVEWHKAFGLTKPRGWDFQLKDEPTLQLEVQRDRRWLYQEFKSGHAWDLSGHLDGRLGNLRTDLGVGGMLRLGKQLTREFPTRTIASGAGGGSMFAFGDLRAVGRDLFLDGNTWQDSRSVEKERVVGEIGIGVELNINRVHLRVSRIWRSEEFETQVGSRSVYVFEFGF